MSNYQDKESSENRKFSRSELNWVRANYRSLKVREEGELLRGLLVFSAKYKDRDNKELELSGKYNVEIRIGSNNIPHVLEKGGYLQARADELGKDIIDMHVYPKSKEICMGTMPMMKAIYAADPTIKGIFYNLIIRYFYYHTYWKQEGVEPWDGLKHGNAGIIEEYVDNPAGSVFEYSECLFHDLHDYLNSGRELRRKRKICVCRKHEKENCHCGIEKKYRKFQKDFFNYRNNHQT